MLKREQHHVLKKIYLLQYFFCSGSSLQLASTRWVKSTIKLCTVHSLSLSSALSINLDNIDNFYENLGSMFH